MALDTSPDNGAMLFTHGRWLVHAGQENAFVSAWEQFAAWATAELPAGPWAVLLRDRENPRQFFSFGPWDSLGAIEDFRSHPQFSDFQGRVRPMLEAVEIFTLDAAAHGGDAAPL